MPHKGEKRKGAKPGQRLAYDDTKDFRKKATKTTRARPTTTHGEARKTAPVGSRLAFEKKPAARKAPAHLALWHEALGQARRETGHKGVACKGSKCHAMAKKLYDAKRKK
jgi:hypothetical protein